jgi:hypothetical protein
MQGTGAGGVTLRTHVNPYTADTVPQAHRVSSLQAFLDSVPGASSRGHAGHGHGVTSAASTLSMTREEAAESARAARAAAAELAVEAAQEAARRLATLADTCGDTQHGKVWSPN